MPTAVPPEGRVSTCHGSHEIRLHHRAEQGPPDRRVVERRMQLVHPDDADIAQHVQDGRRDRAVCLQHRQQVQQGLLDPIHLSGLQRGDGRARIGVDQPFDPVEMHPLRPGHEVGDAVARLIAGEPVVDEAGAGNALRGVEAERAAADHLRHLGEGVGHRQPFRHHHADIGARLAQGQRQLREGPGQAEADGAVVGRGQLGGGGQQQAAHDVALAPAPDAGDAVAGQHGRAVMEQQAGAQRERPQLAVILRQCAGQHLGRHGGRAVLAVQRVEHQEGVVAGDVGGSPDRVQDGHVGLGDEFQRAGRLRDGGPGQTQGRCGCEKGAAAYHAARPRTVSAIPVNRRTPWSSAASSMSKSMAWWTLATSLPTMK